VKPFPPALKERRRYISVSVVAEQPVSDEAASKALNGAVFSLLGEKGFADADFSILEFQGGRGIARASTGSLYDVLAALAFLSSVEGVRARCEATAVSGTVRRLRRKQSI
jgi:RNase P/RNase MRP subunit POP5